MSCSESDYAYLRKLVRRQSANEIDPSRNALFDTRLTPMARDWRACRTWRSSWMFCGPTRNRNCIVRWLRR
jgi:hypothetical protein